MSIVYEIIAKRHVPLYNDNICIDNSDSEKDAQPSMKRKGQDLLWYIEERIARLLRDLEVDARRRHAPNWVCAQMYGRMRGSPLFCLRCQVVR